MLLGKILIVILFLSLLLLVVMCFCNSDTDIEGGGVEFSNKIDYNEYVSPQFDSLSPRMRSPGNPYMRKKY